MLVMKAIDAKIIYTGHSIIFQQMTNTMTDLLDFFHICMHSPSLIRRLRALESFMSTSSSFSEMPVPLCSCGAGALLVAQEL